MKNETDLRVIKTEYNIRDSFFKLLQEKSLHKITVKEICDGAKCSRNTFYVHYQDKDALYNSITDECIAQIKKGFALLIDRVDDFNEEIADQYVDRIITSFENVSDTLQILLENDSSNLFYIKLIDVIYQDFIEYGKYFSPKAETCKAYHLSCMYTISGLVGYMIHRICRISCNTKDAKEILRPLLTTNLMYGAKYLKE